MNGFRDLMEDTLYGLALLVLGMVAFATSIVAAVIVVVMAWKIAWWTLWLLGVVP
jgi:uncharacterized membrane protein